MKKKILALSLSIVMAFSLSTTAMAADSNVDNIQSEDQNAEITDTEESDNSLNEVTEEVQNKEMSVTNESDVNAVSEDQEDEVLYDEEADTNYGMYHDIDVTSIEEQNTNENAVLDSSLDQYSVNSNMNLLSTYGEGESNNSYSAATSISLGSTYTGTIGNSSDKDYFKISPSSNGYISINFNHTYSNDSGSWRVYVFEYSNGAYTELSRNYVNLSSNERIALPSIGAKANGTYYVMIDCYYSGCVGKNYSLSTSFSSSNYYEKELNNVYSTATAISLGSTYTGTSNNSSDQDYYKITPTSNGYISINFNHTYSNDSGSWKVYVYDYSNGAYTELSRNYINLSSNERIALPSIGAKAYGTYYVVVECYYSGCVGTNYSLSTSFKSSDYYEKEINNVYSSATAISLGSTYTGTSNNSSDKDYYKITPTSNGYVNVNFNHPYSDESGSWRVYTYEYSNGEYIELSKNYIYRSSGNSVVLPSISVQANRTYYVVVECYYSGAVGVNYSVYSSFSKTIPTAFTDDTNGTWYTRGGKVDKSANGVLKGTYNGVTKWGYVKDGKLQKTMTIAKNSSGWWYIASNGFVNFSYNGIASNASGYYKITKGKVTFADNGVIKAGSHWYYLVRSKVTPGPTVQKNSSGWWYIDKTGMVNFSFTGIASNSLGSWYCKGGKVQFGYTGKIKYNGRTYNIVKGKVK